jgi:choline dehydrogenase-like flavoprotein
MTTTRLAIGGTTNDQIVTNLHQPFEEDFCEAAYDVGGKPNTLNDAWSGDHMGFYSSLAAVNRTTDQGKRSYAATGYLRPNLGRSNLKVLTGALATSVILEGNTATGVEFMHGSEKHVINASHEVVLSGGVINSPQLLELSGIGDPDVLKAAGIECKVKNERVGAVSIQYQRSGVDLIALY